MCYGALSVVGYSAGPSGSVKYSEDWANTISFIPLPEIVWSSIHYIWGRPTTSLISGPCSKQNVAVGPPSPCSLLRSSELPRLAFSLLWGITSGDRGCYECYNGYQQIICCLVEAEAALAKPA